MEFRRNGQRQERRRRVLIDEACHEGPRTSSEPQASRRAGGDGCRGYSDAAQRNLQLPITDLLPTRAWTLSVVSLMGLCAIVGLLALYGAMRLHASPLSAKALTAFDPLRSGSLGGWLAAVLLTGVAIAGGLIFTLRRHRVDDYRGRYRAWLWLAPLAAFAGLESVSGLRYAIGEWTAMVCGFSRDTSGGTCWRSIVAVVAVATLSRLAVEMRHCWPAMSCLAAAALLYGGLFAESFAAWLPDCIFRTMLVGGLLLAGHVGLLMSFLLYGRQVSLEAQGIWKPRPRLSAGKAAKSKKSPAGDNPRDTSEIVAAELPAASSRRGASSPIEDRATRETPQIKASSAVSGQAVLRVPANPASAASAAAAADSADCSAKLSKAERRRLKKEQRRQAVQAARD
jgi:hypothetical protein